MQKYKIISARELLHTYIHSVVIVNFLQGIWPAFTHLSVDNMRPILTVSQLVGCFASRYKQQQVGSVGYLEIIGLVTAAQYGSFLLITSNHQTENEKKTIF